MRLESAWKGVQVVVVLSIVGVVLVQAGVVSGPLSPDKGEVRVFDHESESDSADEGEVRVFKDGSGNDSAPESGGESSNETDSEPKAVVDVEVADSYRERYIGLSNHESLEPGNGMLFVHEEERNLTYVMRKMDFDIDIIFIDATGEIATIHHARAPGPNEDGNDLEYSGRGKWVLEVPRGYTNETGIKIGDEVEIDFESNRAIVTDMNSNGLERVAPTADHERAARAAVAAGRVSVRR